MGYARSFSVGDEDRHQRVPPPIRGLPPHFSAVVHSLAQGEVVRVLEEEISSLLNNRAISVLLPTLCQSGFYSGFIQFWMYVL